MESSYFIKSAVNKLSFSLRSILQYSRGAYTEPFETKDILFSDTLLKRESELIKKYKLQDFQKQSSKIRYLESLTYLDFLENLIQDASLISTKETLQWLDVGAKNWSYVQSIVSVLTQTVKDDYELTGIEIDPHRLYQDLHTRKNYAKSFIQSLPNTQYISGDVLKHHNQYHVISSFLPFVFEDPCLAWGLPLEHFDPKAYLGHLISLLKPNGYLIILNQGKDEAEKQEELLGDFSEQIQIEKHAEAMPDSFIDYAHPRFGWRCLKK